jgi:hypothetical protein
VAGYFDDRTLALEATNPRATYLVQERKVRLLLRSPLGLVWRYGMRLRMPENGADPLVLDALGMGDLVHMTLNLALQKLEAAAGLAKSGDSQIATAVQDAAGEVASVWESDRAVPPAVIWRRTLDEARLLASRALSYNDERLPDARSYGEVSFGGVNSKSAAASPWDPTTIVEIADAGFRIAGYIDRLDLSGDGKRRPRSRLQDRPAAQGQHQPRWRS